MNPAIPTEPLAPVTNATDHLPGIWGQTWLMDSSRWMSAAEIAAQVQSGERRTIEFVDEAIGRIEAEDPRPCSICFVLCDGLLRVRSRRDGRG